MSADRWVLAPVEADLHMTVAGDVALTDASRSDLEATTTELQACYRAMIAARPAAPAAESREPLTDEQLLAIAREQAAGTTIKLTRDVGPYEVTEVTHVYKCIARAIERAHGIGAPHD